MKITEAQLRTGIRQLIQEQAGNRSYAEDYDEHADHIRDARTSLELALLSANRLGMDNPDQRVQQALFILQDILDTDFDG